ncbi:hypothetical protein [Pseudonocardia sp. N23]|uniref:hypothetical protein n=1 Tax=Pseudonocardia sp. N23 TaxID=1987376 RepID=UPI000BFE1AF8|nr:hypothetical protein [Pseudonocardia sp. N23]GAY12068.1 hypothetical protein TOK_0458 [Pseudonocardia sp. N23]
MTVTADYPGLYVPDDPTVAHKLIQSETWLVRDDETRQLHWRNVEHMTPSHRAHLLDWLRRNADAMRMHVYRSVNQSFRRYEIDGVQRAELIRDLLGDRPAAEWLEDTALVRRLVALQPAPAPRRDRSRWLPARLRRTR